MKVPKLIAIAVVLTTALLLSTVSAGTPGNGIDINGKHFNLNLIGQTTKKIDNNLDTGHTIFVGFSKSGERVNTTILLTEGDFKVIDKNGVDDGYAAFQLPFPYTTEAGTTACYEVFVRALGTPGGHANMYTCYVDQFDATYCDTGNTVVIKRPTDVTGKNGPVKFDKVTPQLTTVFGEPIFGDENLDYFWQYENYGLRHAQLRFYQTDTCFSHSA